MARHRGQGAFEYILMLSGVLLVVITIVYMMQGSLAQADNTLDAQMKSAGIALDPSFYTPGAKPQFLPSTPADGFGSTTRPNISALITVKDTQLYELKYNWNGANYSAYDSSLVLAMNFDDNAAAGDTAGKLADLSQYGNNGAVYGNTVALLHMDDNSGTKVLDESRFANNGTCYNMNGGPGVTACNWTTGKNGPGIAFDAVDDHLSLPASASLDVDAEGSLEMWVNAVNGPSDSKYHRLAVAVWSDGSQWLFSKGYDDVTAPNTLYWYEIPTNNNIQAGSAALSPNSWHHVCYTWKVGGYMTVYVDGVSRGSSGALLAVRSRTLSSLNVGQRWNGSIDEVGIYNRLLPSGEVLAQYNAGKAKHANWDPNGKWNGAMKFDGIDDQVVIPNSASVNITGNITVSAWTKKEQMPCTTNPGPPITYPGCHDQPVIVKGDSTYTSASTPYSLTWGWGNDFYFRLWAKDGTSMGVSVPGGVSNADAWHYVAGTFDGTDLRVYVDGALAATSSYPGKRIAFSNSNAYLGRLPNGYLYQGAIDEPRIWNRALPASEVNMQYRSNLYKYNPNAWLFEYRNDALTYGTYNYTVYASGGYRKDGSSETRTVKYCQLAWPC